MPTLKILTFNVKMLPGPGGEERAAKIIKAINANKYDIICLQEVFDEDIREMFVEGFGRTLKHQVPKCHDNDLFNEDSGLFFASKHPIESWGYKEFNECSFTDCWADKGIFGARLSFTDGKKPFTFLLFNTHLQSEVQYQQTRVSQLRQLRRFIGHALTQLDVHANENDKPRNDIAVMLCGDMNVIGDVDQEYNSMKGSLGFPRDLFREKSKITIPGYTWDCKENSNMIPDDDGDRLRLDYMFAFNRFPTDNGQGTLLRNISCTKVSVQPFATTPTTRLSDHFGVEAVVKV
ncbi:MAG: sphingomyelin phosphodiesterase [Ignavibacteriae bacterium]|nr:sphingomyelin phosphodiesterase [Ignavibacteriota bacterium]